MFSRKNLVKKHEYNSKNAIAVFETVIKELDDADIFIQEDIDYASGRVDQLMEDKAAMEKIQAKNASLSTRLKELIGM